MESCSSADWQGALLTAAGVIGVLALAAVAEKLLRLSKEQARKVVHIGVGQWVLFARELIGPSCAHAGAALLGAFVVLNSLSLYTRIFAVMELTATDRASRGTVYYPAALALVTLWYWATDLNAVVAASMVLAWGDGVAALVGSGLGKRAHRYANSRSFEGSVAMVVAATVSSALAVRGEPRAWTAAFLTSVAAAAVEAVCPGDLDNIAVPLLVAPLWHWFTAK